jgi:hypothetical protein
MFSSDRIKAYPLKHFATSPTHPAQKLATRCGKIERRAGANGPDEQLRGVQ